MALLDIRRRGAAVVAAPQPRLPRALAPPPLDGLQEARPLPQLVGVAVEPEARAAAEAERERGAGVGELPRRERGQQRRARARVVGRGVAVQAGDEADQGDYEE